MPTITGPPARAGSGAFSDSARFPESGTGPGMHKNEQIPTDIGADAPTWHELTPIPAEPASAAG
jgi:hypothetical protein